MRAWPGNGYKMRDTFIEQGIGRLKEPLPDHIERPQKDAAE